MDEDVDNAEVDAEVDEEEDADEVQTPSYAIDAGNPTTSVETARMKLEQSHRSTLN